MREDVPLAAPQLTEQPARQQPAGLTEGCRPAPRQAGSIVDEPRWDVYYAVVFAACVAIVEAGRMPVAGRIVATAALAAMVPWYLLLGRPLVKADDATQAAGARGTVYLAGLVVLFTAVQSQNPNAWFLAFALLPMCFQVTTMRRGLVFVVIFNVIAGALLVWRYPGLSSALTAFGIVVFAVAFSYAYSRWVARVIEQSLERAALIEQLESARAELAAAHHQAGVLAERHRLAGEIHDTLAQGFTSIVTLLQAAQASLEPDRPENRQARHHLGLALATARENLAEARSLVTALSPAALEAATLGAAISRVTSTAAAQAGFRAEVEVTGAARRLPTGTEVVLLRVGQEALANARKHAAAGHVEVRLCYADAAVRLTVTDDGKGFDPDETHGGYGLSGMRDRVRQVGGTVTITARPGAGTEVRAEVPG